MFAGNTNYNTQSGDVAITINAWSLTGFYQPVTMTVGVFNTVKGGSTVPLKFNIYTTAAHTTEMTSLSDVSGFGVVQIGCGASGQEDPVDFVTTEEPRSGTTPSSSRTGRRQRVRVTATASA